MEQQVDEKLVSVLENAVEQALTKLFKEHRENYYYITLTEGGLDLTVKTVPWDEVTVTTDDIHFEG